jgi:hypothetical protein
VETASVKNKWLFLIGAAVILISLFIFVTDSKAIPSGFDVYLPLVIKGQNPAPPAPTVPPYLYYTPTPGPKQNCSPSYPTVRIPPPPPNLDCKDISFRNFTVLPPDPPTMYPPPSANHPRYLALWFYLTID